MNSPKLLTFILWIYTYSPIYLINEYIDGLQMTSNPDSYLTPPQIIARNGYPAETHSVLTSDGFLLQLHRIPRGISAEGNASNGYPILLIHGSCDSSAAWILNGPERSLSYLLADQGYDVWMINTRGNTFSTSHVKYTPMEKEFWDFSYYEIGVYDLPASIDFILKKTNHEKLFCMAHSIGNPVFYIMLSVLPQYNDKVVGQISLAPFTTLSYQYMLTWPVFGLKINAEEYLYWNTPGSTLTHDVIMKLLLSILNSVHIFGYTLTELLLKFLYGFHLHDINKNAMVIFYNNFPAGTSIKSGIHSLQMEESFGFYDYGAEENLKIYGTSKPPQYNFGNIRVPIRVYYGLADPVAAPVDAKRTYEKMPIKAGIVEIADPKFAHLDFVSNLNVNELLNNDILNIIPQMISDASNAT